ncbi:MAG TPA: diguanylate cyclase [Gaiellaceae bacterium]|nr:diguanylate cyclase [Gaiellaceae bacterium]
MEGDDAARVLVVEDDERSRYALVELLAPLGEEVLAARDGREALAIAREEELALVLLDVGLPVLDGFETARLLKADERSRHVPIIFLTAHADGEAIARGYEAGAVDYLLKPFEPEILLAKVSVFVDLYRLRRDAAVLTHRALHDPLTGAPNRTLFLDRLQTAIARLGRGDSGIAVLFVDLNEFKQINDAVGHQAGDEVLVEVARRLQSVVRAADTVARFGGDEFLVLCEGIDEVEAAEVERRIEEAARFEVAVDGRLVQVSATVGRALADDPLAVPEELIRRADLAMFAAKRGARAT